jgi:histidinol-phosphatase (PHP family)
MNTLQNLHQHTTFCDGHNTPDEIVQHAIELGFGAIGFSGHCYMPFAEYYCMSLEGTKEYRKEIARMKEKYADQIQILLGVECEYYPTYFAETVQHLRDAGINYMIQGQHWIGDEENEPYCGSATDSETVLRRFVDQTIEGMKTGLFTYLAHPDLLRYVGDDESYERHMARLCEAAKELDMPLEINLLGFRAGRNYPDTRFWKLAGEAGCKVLLGCDAHMPEDFLDKTAIEKAMAMVQQYGLTLLETVPLQSIG